MRSFVGEFLWAMSPVLVGIPCGIAVALVTNWSSVGTLIGVAVGGLAWIAAVCWWAER